MRLSYLSGPPGTPHMLPPRVRSRATSPVDGHSYAPWELPALVFAKAKLFATRTMVFPIVTATFLMFIFSDSRRITIFPREGERFSLGWFLGLSPGSA